MTVQKLAVIPGKYHIIVAKRTIVKKKNPLSMFYFSLFITKLFVA